MVNKKRLLLYTFFSVLISIFVVGFVGITLSLKYIQDTYIELQLDVNKRQARYMARILESELKRGVPEDSVINNLQSAIQGSDVEKGYLCMFAQNDAELVCHPNPGMVGKQVPTDFAFDETQTKKNTQALYDVITSGKEDGGVLKRGKGIADEVTYMTPVEGTDWMLSAHENTAKLKQEIERQRRVFIFGAIVFGFFMALGATLGARSVSRRYERQIEEKNVQLDKSLRELQILHAEVSQQKEEIEAQRDELQIQKNRISEQNKSITASIQYASRIQNAILPPKEMISKILDDYFIFYLPRDIVSGDFYWLSKIEPDNNDNKELTVVAAADCTGHGVPGAFMSMLGVAFLNEIVGKDSNKDCLCRPDEILNQLREQIIVSLRQTGKKGEPRDGMDIALCIIDHTNRKLHFSGANNPLYLFRKNDKNKDEDYTFIEIKADKMPIGFYTGEQTKFSNHELDIMSGDTIYIFSDGFVDQFGGKRNRKFLSKNFKKMLLEIQGESMNKQSEILIRRFDEWKDANEQVDDILVIGVKIQ